MKRLFLLGALVLAGCASQVEIDPPAELAAEAGPEFLARVWDVGAGAGPGAYRYRLAPVAQDGVIYVGDHRGRVTALRLDDGARLWRVDTGKPLSAGPTLVDGTLYFGTADAEVLALAADGGAQRWAASVGSEVLTPPGVAGTQVVVSLASGQVVALARDTGALDWRQEFSVPSLTLRGVARPVHAHGGWLIGQGNGRLAVLEAATGRPYWDRPVASPSGRNEIERIVDVDADPVVQGDRAYVAAYQGRVAALELQNGSTVWERELSVDKAFAVQDDTLYAVDAKSHLWALHAGTGASLWKQDALAHRRLTAPVAWRDTLVVADFEGYLHRIGRTDGRLSGRVRLADEAPAAPPLMIGEQLLVWLPDGDLQLYRPAEAGAGQP